MCIATGLADGMRKKMVMMAVFALVVVIMICGGVLLARLATVAKSKKSWIWGFFILIVLICVPLFLLCLGAWFLFFSDISSERFSPFG
jgi:surface polysaccharide O-acyltransferase-like enzyme